ncbi:hypothetical protein [Terrisporobacter hibernicus]|uniref:Uncharacterized protein n=1 Tax=Terrisporobacter hibernicus TaxID=2813371 RepID=A0AAX2ZFP7_9FIRM|nr:hypothetical protein [Terrisporobacter hibernicus]UEL47575.1 hypothetical protein JW646_18450 [Terrisporobacter hibernicus]
MDRDKVKVIKYEKGYDLYINDIEMKHVGDFKIDEFGIYSDITIKLCAVDLEIENEKTIDISAKSGGKIELKIDRETVAKEIINFGKGSARPKCFGGYNTFLCCSHLDGKCSFARECEKSKCKRSE